VGEGEGEGEGASSPRACLGGIINSVPPRGSFSGLGRDALLMTGVLLALLGAGKRRLGSALVDNPEVNCAPRVVPLQTACHQLSIARVLAFLSPCKTALGASLHVNKCPARFFH